MSKAIRLTQPTKEPAYVSRNEGIPLRKNEKPADRFVYAHYPTRWEFNAEHGFLPTLSKIPARPGVNGVSPRGDLTNVLVVIQQQGGKFIDPTDARLGEYMDYVQYYTCENGAKWWVDSCMEATVLPGRKVMWKAKPGAWDGFRVHLRNAGLVDPLVPEVYELMLEKQRNKIERKAARSGMNPIYKAQYDAEIEKLEAMESAWAGMLAAEAEQAEAKPKRKRKAKAVNLVTGAE
tara:strand:- start:6348 stop:7049 length:702 start_codon:yes stop_codon:yes gene_type:complete